MLHNRYNAGLWERAVFDPATMLAVGTGSTIAGGGLSALATLAGGGSAKQAGLLQQQAEEFKAKQAEQNAGLAIASSQVKMADTQLRTSQAISTSTARAAASGVDAGTGSAATNVGELAKRGTYLASLDLYNGESQATGLLNEAKGFRYSGEIARMEGEEKEKASELQALATLAGSAGSAFKMYGKV
ncbi:MAG TPA: hypothetical protein VNH21_03155 [Steroidobacteraceae bacterium]|nr:hypothetical protein [Steroidobacteraceae bacterium]